MRHTPEVNGASSPPLLYAGCASPLETGLFPVHARWCPRGSRKGALRDRVPPKARAAGPAVRTRTAPARRPSGQDAGHIYQKVPIRIPLKYRIDKRYR